MSNGQKWIAFGLIVGGPLCVLTTWLVSIVGSYLLSVPMTLDLMRAFVLGAIVCGCAAAIAMRPHWR